jgi:hypothetical protein
MNTLSDKIVSTIARQTERFGLFNSVLDWAVSKILPQTTAAAACSGVLCFYTCEGTCGPNARARYATYATSQANCDNGTYSATGCYTGCIVNCAF